MIFSEEFLAFCRFVREIVVKCNKLLLICNEITVVRMSENANPLFLGSYMTILDLFSYRDRSLLLSEDQKQIIQRCREILNEINGREEPVYGVSTGFGHLENKWIPPSKQGQLQINLIRSHAIGTGEEVPSEIVKMAMILLANSLSKGHSGIRLETLERIIFYIKHDIIPVSYSIGSLGASGDLAPLAHIALALIGEGQVYYKNKIYPSNNVLIEFGLDPLTLEAKEGLALINGTHFITAYSLLLLKRLKMLIELSCIASSLSLEALRGTDTPFDHRIATLRGHHGHITISTIMRGILKGSKIIESHQDPRIDHKTQDAYAFRCIPQVMGAIWDCCKYLEEVINTEINAVTDNPLIFPEDGEILSGGNFHAEPLGFPIEGVCMALIELANITEARISRLVSPFTPELPAFLANKPGIESGYMIAHYTVAALLNKLRSLGFPNIVDNIPVSGGQEDHVSMAMNSVTRSWKIIDGSKRA